MTLRDLHFRLEHAGVCCTTCGTIFGTRMMSGAWLRTGGICHVCDDDTTVLPVMVFDHLRRGRTLVGRMADGHFDEDTILALLQNRSRQAQEAA